jgi:hypothetical protein
MSHGNEGESTTLWLLHGMSGGRCSLRTRDVDLQFVTSQ